MALLKSKAAKAAAMTAATRILEAAPASAQGSAADWSISQLSALYTEHRTQLVSQARRITRDEAEANEVVQEAFLKFMLAAPELDSADRAIAYLRTSVTNLSLNIIRARGARPNLVAIDADTTQERLNEIASENHIDLDTSITAAEDAAIIREALSRLTSDQRTALVMWEMEGRTTEEIATALNTSPANVRHILVRARKSMVRVLEEWVVDDATGLTALNALSTTYKKAAQIAQKSSKAALSLLLVITAFLGFNSMTGNEGSVVSTLPSVTAVTEKAPAAAIFRTESPIQLLERVKKVHSEWIKPGHRSGNNTHNVSATVSIKEDEWDLVGDWMWNNRKFYNGLSVLPYNGGTYTQAPFEDCTEEDFNKLLSALEDVDLTKVIELQDNTDLRGEAACSGNQCEIV